MAVLLGVAALTLDASFMYAKRARLHAAADAAAKSAAIENLRYSAITQAGLNAFADQQVGAHGFVSTRLGGTTSVVVNRPPASGPFAGQAGYVEAIVSEPTSTFFGKLLGWTSMTPGASAVAGGGPPGSCMIVTEDMSVGNSTLTLNGCGLSVGGDLHGGNPNARVTGTPLPPVGVTGTCTGRCGGFGDLTTGAPAPIDPLAGLALPTTPDPGDCGPGTTATLGPGCYTSIGTGVRTLTGGIYYITGPVNIDDLTGNNVMLFLAGPNGRLTSGNNKDLNLTAPTSGPYAGIAIFQDPANTNNFAVGNAFTMNVSGAIYMPGADVNFANHISIGSTTCTLFIAKSLTITNGNGQFSTGGCAGLYGGAAYLTISIAQ